MSGRYPTQLQVVNGRWRGIMPSRCLRADRELLEQYRRTGEPSLAASILDSAETRRRGGVGKAMNSFTEGMREALWYWMKEKYGSILTPIIFEYKLSRHRIITVIGSHPYLRHEPYYGRGKKGFILQLCINSIDGILCQGPIRIWFAWDRIIGKEKMLYLPEGIRN